MLNTINHHNKLLKVSILSTVISWGVVGYVATLLGMVGLLYPMVSVILVIPFFYLLSSLRVFFEDIFELLHQTKVFYKIILLLLFITLCSHFVGVLLPETGFDALWYHLPTIREYVIQHRLVYDTRWYQTLYPQLGDIIFLLGFQIGGVFGAKVIAYCCMVTLLLMVFVWLKEEVRKEWAVAGTIVVALFQVVGWQASSVYVDVISAMFFVAGCYCLRRGDAMNRVSTIMFGFFLSTKYINLGFIPLIAVIFLLRPRHPEPDAKQPSLSGPDVVQKHIVSSVVLTAIAILIASFWYLRAYYYTGNLLYPRGTEYATPVIAQMEKGGWSEWLLFRAQTIYLLPYDFFFRNDGYVTALLWILPLIIVGSTLYKGCQSKKWLHCFSVTLLTMKQWSNEARTFIEKGFSQKYLFAITGIYGLLFWWFFPPPSTRYVLGQVIVLWIGVMMWLGKWLENWKMGELENRKIGILVTIIQAIFVLSIVGYLSIRLYVNTRGIPYILGRETQGQYLNRFRNGFLDEKIDGFYN